MYVLLSKLGNFGKNIWEKHSESIFIILNWFMAPSHLVLLSPSVISEKESNEVHNTLIKRNITLGNINLSLHLL